MKREQIVEMIKSILKEHGVPKAYLFGSFARNEKTYHDIDVVIEPPVNFSFLDLAHVENVLEERIKKKFDVLTFGSISRHLKPYIDKDLVQIL